MDNLKLEEPLLATDHETDVWNFQRSAARCLDLETLMAHCTPKESNPSEDFQDEWNDILSGRSLKELKPQLRREKVHATRDTLIYTTQILKDNMAGERDEALTAGLGLNKMQELQENTMSPFTTPESSPRSSPPTSPESGIGLGKQDWMDLDNLLLHVEAQMQETDKSENVPETVDDLRVEGETLAESVQRITEEGEKEHMKSETISPTHIEYRRPNDQANAATIAVDGQVQAPLLTDTLPKTSDKDFSDGTTDPMRMEEYDEYFKALVEASPEDTERHVQKPGITRLGEPFKVPVPAMEALVVQLPSQTAQDKVLDSLLGNLPPSWRVASSLDNESGFSWLPSGFSSIQPALEERIEDTGAATEYKCPPKDIIGSEQMLWKQPGLRLLDSDEDSDEEIGVDEGLAHALSATPEPQIPEKRFMSDPAPLSSLGKKITLERRATLTSPPKRPPTPRRDRLSELIASKISLSTPNTSLSATTKKPVTCDSPFSASTSLNTFLDLRGSKFKRVEGRAPPWRDEIPDDPIQTTQSEHSDCIKPELSKSDQPEHVEEVRPSGQIVQVPATPPSNTFSLNKMRLQPLKTLNEPRSIVIDSEMLRKDPSLIAYLETQGGDWLTMIYRDMRASSPNEPSLEFESADIILNARAALIFTHLQALNQRNLPGRSGSRGQGLVQSRITKLVKDYDYVSALVTIPCLGDSLSEATQAIIAGFAGFCSSWSREGTKVCPIWVSASTSLPGGEKEVHRRTWDLIRQHAFPAHHEPYLDSVSLIHEETLWELFLRKAGVNPMAAQVVLGMLKTSETANVQIEQSWGLRKLAQLKPEARMDMFGKMLGPKTVEKLNLAFDNDGHMLRHHTRVI
ncbi:hypothetical protein LTS15_006455 [Exophiala xenobiotica]|nr:hypothetical protein LTS15_006455 [Exophiala xenobiotica]